MRKSSRTIRGAALAALVAVAVLVPAVVVACGDGQSEASKNATERFTTILGRAPAADSVAAQVAKSHHLDTPSLGTSCASNDFEKMRRLMDAALVMNCRMIRVASSGYNGKEHYDALFSKVRKDYETVEKVARELGFIDDTGSSF